ncbi:MAG: hypothetical protein ACYDIE_09510 [Candidatus Krumholzibacteriia bacterium]
MKRVAILLALVLLAGDTRAASPYVNSIGFWFDEVAYANVLPSAPLFARIDAYLLATDLTEPGGLSGWEAEVRVVPAPRFFPPVYTIANNGLNVMTAPIFQVGMAEALPAAPVMKLLTVSLWNEGNDFCLAVGPCTPSSLSGLYPVYANGYDPGLLIELIPRGWSSPDLPPNFYFSAVFGIYPWIANEQDSWGGVKNLYR